MPSGIFLCGIRLKPVHAGQHCCDLSCFLCAILYFCQQCQWLYLQLAAEYGRFSLANLKPCHADAVNIFTRKKLHCTETTKVVWTRQHSTQSVGNMPPPSPRHLLPHILQIMPRNPKFDQFQPKGHHNMENSQSTTKMPGNPKFDPFH